MVDEAHHLVVLREGRYTIEHPPGCEECPVVRLIDDLGWDEAIDGVAEAAPGRYRLRYTEGVHWVQCVILGRDDD